MKRKSERGEVKSLNAGRLRRPAFRLHTLFLLPILLVVSCVLSWYTSVIMSPLGIQRTVAFLLIFSPWIFIPSLIKDVIFIVAGILLYISTLDLRKKPVHHEPHHEETESKPPVQHTSPLVNS